MNIQLPHLSSFIGALECTHTDKYIENSEYDVLKGSISSIYTARLPEGLSDEAATVPEINTKERHSKVDANILTQIWRIRLGPAHHTLKNTIKCGIRHVVHPLTYQYNTDIIHGYNVRRLNTIMYFDTLFLKFISLNGNTCE